jgi:hypothetical protein
MTKKSRPRAERRAAERSARKLRDDLVKLYAVEPGGSPKLPIDLTSASQVEVDALSRRCPLCESDQRVTAHDVETHDTHRLRVARLQCKGCHATWNRYYRLLPERLN